MEKTEPKERALSDDERVQVIQEHMASLRFPADWADAWLVHKHEFSMGMLQDWHCLRPEQWRAAAELLRKGYVLGLVLHDEHDVATVACEVGTRFPTAMAAYDKDDSVLYIRHNSVRARYEKAAYRNRAKPVARKKKAKAK